MICLRLKKHYTFYVVRIFWSNQTMNLGQANGKFFRLKINQKYSPF